MQGAAERPGEAPVFASWIQLCLKLSLGDTVTRRGWECSVWETTAGAHLPALARGQHEIATGAGRAEPG